MVVVTTFSKTKIGALYSTNLLVEKWSKIVETGIVLGNLQCVITKLKATLRLSQGKKGPQPHPLFPVLSGVMGILHFFFFQVLGILYF